MIEGQDNSTFQNRVLLLHAEQNPPPDIMCILGGHKIGPILSITILLLI